MVPKNEEIKNQILTYYHDHALGGHMSRDRLINILSNRFYWPKLYQDAKDYVRSCEACQKVKTTRPLSNGLLNPIEVTRPFQLVGVDIVILRPTTNRNKYILVTIDYFTNWVEAVPMKNQSAEECTKAFFSSVISRHGCPEELMSDSGTQFLSGTFDQFCKDFNLKQRESAPYFHQPNGKVEKFIAFLKSSLALVTSLENKHRWDEMIDHCLLVYRTTVSRMLNDTPFYLIYGRDALLPQDLAFGNESINLRGVGVETNQTYQKELVKQMKLAYDNLIQQKQKEQMKYKLYYDRKHEMVTFKIGDEVLKLNEAPTRGPLMPKWDGPFRIIAKLNNEIYRIENEERITTVHVSQIVKYYRRSNVD